MKFYIGTEFKKMGAPKLDMVLIERKNDLIKIDPSSKLILRIKKCELGDNFIKVTPYQFFKKLLYLINSTPL